MTSRFHHKGFSIIELMVSLAITSIVMYGALQLFQEGMQLFRVNQAASDSQVAVTKAISILSAEVANASPRLVKHYSSSGGGGGGGAGTPGAGLDGLVFATPLTEDGSVRYDPANGQLYWQRYIAFYFVPDNDNELKGKVFRAEEPVAAEPGGTGLGNRDVEHVLMPFITSHNTNYFSGSGAAKRRTIASGISGFTVKEYQFSSSEFATITGPGGGPAFHKRAFDIEIEAGDRAKAFRNSYYLRVSIRVTPGAR